MSGEALYERYKDALKRGHVASLRGRLEEALTAYAEAAAIAPERSTPHTSAGTALMRRKRPADALRHYAVALQLTPHDETALLGRAQALAALDRRGEAADAFDALAEVRTAGGKLADAVDAARRGLELAEGRERRRALQRLIERLRASEPGEPGRVALDRALQLLDGAAVAAPGAPVRLPIPPVAASPPAAPAETPEAEPDGRPAEAAPAGGPPAELAAAGPAVRAALDRDLPDGVPVADLARAADEAMDEAGGAAAVERLLDLAAAHRRDGKVDAALDACYLGLSIVPDHIGLHLALVELYDERGWAALGTEKLALLDRLAALDSNADAAAGIAAARGFRGG